MAAAALAAALTLAVLLPAAAFAGETEGDSGDYLPELRVLFYSATLEEPAVDAAMSFLRSRLPPSPEGWPPVARAYFGALEGLRAKYSGGLFDKLAHLKTAIVTLRDLPERNPGSLEILFLRFSLFHQVPGFFGLRHTVGPDLGRLVSMLESGADPAVPPDIRRDMVLYLLGCGEADAAQIGRLEMVLVRQTAER
ncbi:MAG TPA: hypothetical protein VMV03_16175 [Spirochaetia bacterium]|nr:hypothetical protein [Spirochaetia bacterium]